MIVALWIVLWIVGGIPAAGFTYAYFDAEFPTLRKHDGRHRELLGRAALFLLLGPIGSVVAFCTSGFAQHGWRLK